MARPKKEGMDYFPHDTDAVNDEKIEALRLLYGNDGYAFYFILLERIYRSKDFEIDISDEETIQILCRKIDVNEERFYKILETALKRRCFCRDSYEQRGVLTSEGIKKRANVVLEKRSRMADKYRQDKSEGVSAAETNAEMRQKVHKVKESKVKESKVKESNLKPLSTAEAAPKIPYQEIVDYLNQKTGKGFNHQAKKTRDCIRARYNDGFTKEDFFKVIDNKVRQWKHSPKMEPYLRPTTLFSGKFDNYLNEGGEHGETGNDLGEYDFSKGIGFSDDD